MGTIAAIVTTVITAAVTVVLQQVKQSNINQQVINGQAILSYEPFKQCPDHFYGQIADGKLEKVADDVEFHGCVQFVLKMDGTQHTFSNKVGWDSKSKECFAIINNINVYRKESAHLCMCQLEQHYALPQYLVSYKNRINVAFTGDRGVGKSTLINTIRGLTARDPNAAPVGSTETTMVPTPYEYSYEGLDIILWDLPGCGTVNNPKSDYIKVMGLKYFDNVLFSIGEGFRECDTAIAKELKDMTVPTYFVKTKANIDFENEAEDHDLSCEQAKQEIAYNLTTQHGIRPLYFVGKHMKTRIDPYIHCYDYAQLMLDILCNLFKYRGFQHQIPVQCNDRY
eukprot:479621_1